MPLNWTDFSSTSYYRGLPDTEREAARMRFFDDQVAPRFAPEQRESALTEFNRRTMTPATLTRPARPVPQVQRPQANISAPKAPSPQMAMPQAIRPAEPRQPMTRTELPRPAPKGGAGFVEGIKDFGRGMVRGAVEDVPAAAAGLADYADTPDFDAAGRMTGDAGASEWARETAAAAEKRGENWQQSEFGRQMAERDAFSVRGGAHQVGRALAMSFSPGLAGAATGAAIGSVVPGVGTLAGAGVGYMAGSIAALPLFFGHQAKDTYDKVFAQTKADNPEITDEDAHDRAMAAGGGTGAVEAAGELVADLVGAKVFKLLPSGVKQGMVRAATKSFQGVRPMITDLLKITAAEVSTELAQGAAQAEIEQAYNVGEGAKWDDLKRVIVPTVLTSLVGGGATIGVSASARYRDAKLLSNPSFPPAQRAQAAQRVARALHAQDPELATLFLGEAERQILAGKPVIAEDDKFYRDLKPLDQREIDKRMAAGDFQADDAAVEPFGAGETAATDTIFEQDDDIAIDDEPPAIVPHAVTPPPEDDAEGEAPDGTPRESATETPPGPAVEPLQEQAGAPQSNTEPQGSAPSDGAALTREQRAAAMNEIGARLKVLRAERAASAGNPGALQEIDDELRAVAANLKRVTNNLPPVPTPREQAATTGQGAETTHLAARLNVDLAQAAAPQADPVQPPAMPALDRGALSDTARRLQNRDRSSQQSIAQMTAIAGNPDPDLLMAAPTAQDGAPVVADLASRGLVAPEQLGAEGRITIGGRKVPFRYAVVEADSVLASNNMDGTRNEGYAQNFDRLTAITNGRTAGLQGAYARGTADAYREAIAAAQAVHGIAPERVAGMRSPVLVRVIDAQHATGNLGDETNTGNTLGLSAVEQARTDASRFDIAGITLTEDGRIAPEALQQFVQAMPQAEQQTLAPNGQPTATAATRLRNATFFAAYQNDELVGEIAESTDPDAVNILNAMTKAAASFARLEGAGEYDVRPIVIEAAKQVLTAARKGQPLKNLIAQTDIDSHPWVTAVLEMFAANSRSAKRIGERLEALARAAYAEATAPAADMFGERPKKSVQKIIEETLYDEGQGGPRQTDARAAGAAGQRGGDVVLPVDDERQPQAGRPPADGGDRGARQEERPALDLTGETEGDLAEKARQDGLRKAAEAEEQSRARADAQRDDFVLAGSNRPADQAIARGQNELFGAAPAGDAVTAAAHQAATSPQNDLPVPTTAQKEASAIQPASVGPALDARGDKARGDSVLAAAKLFGNDADAEAVRVHGFDSLDVERQHVVLSKVRAALDDEKILDAVIKTVPIDVVNVLVGGKLAPDSLRYNKSVLSRGLTVARDVAIPKPVARFIDALASSVEIGSAGGRAEKSGLSGGASAIELPADRGSAVEADGVGDGHMAVTVNGQTDTVNVTPTDAQKEAGVYKKAHVTWNGLDITIENPAGSKRRPEWPTLAAHYGYLKRTEGADGDHVDVFLNPDENRTDKVVVIDQLKGGKQGAGFDEHKVMLGFSDKAAAIIAYKANYTKGWNVGPVTEMTLGEFKEWLAKGDQTAPVQGEASAAARPPEPQLSAEEMHAEKVRRSAVELARITAEEARQQDFSPNEIAKAVRMQAKDDRIPADELRQAFLAEIAAPGSGLGEGRVRQIRQALSPTRENGPWQESAASSEGAPKRKRTFTFAIKPYAGGFIIESDDGGGLVIDGKPRGPSILAPTTARIFKSEADARAYMQKKGMTEAAAVKPKSATPEAGDATAQLAAMSADDLAALFDDVAGEMDAVPSEKPEKARAAQARKPGEPRPVRRTRTPAEASQRGGRSATEAAKSLGVNLSSAGAEALEGLAKLFGGPGRLNSGLTFDEETYAKAKPHFETMLRDFSAAGRDLRDLVRAIIEMFGTGVKPYLMRFAQEVQQDAQRGNTDLERDRQNAGNGDETLGAAGSDRGSAGNGGRAEQGARQDRRDGSDGADLFDGGAPADGGRGDRQLDSGERPVAFAGGAPGPDDGRGGGGAGGLGVLPDRDGAQGTAPTAGGGDLQRRLAAQRRAETIPLAPGIDNIRETLPLLLEGQQEDVHKTETSFAKPDGYGMLFANGTGTGKTFLGLGVVKRFARAGKNNILIVAPDQKIMEDWIESASALGLSITALPDTKSAGTGIVITTYANLGENIAIVHRDWDLVVGDEAHFLTQDKKGTTTKALAAFRALTLHPRGAHRRAAMLNPDLLEEMERLQAIVGQKLSDDMMDQMYHAARAEQEKAQAELTVLFREWRRVSDEVVADVASRQGEKRPRALFLSATPFAYEFSIDWAEGYLFDYAPPGETVDSSRYNSGDARERFFVQHFGYRMRYNKLTEPDAKVDRGIMQRQFNTWLKSQGVLSNRMLDVPLDYDRRFVLVSSAIGRRIDEALDWLREQASGDNPAYRNIENELRDTFDYLSRRYLLEAIKATESVKHVRAHMALGRKVVVFHDYKKGGGFNPFLLPEGADPGYMAARDAFNSRFGDLVNAELHKLPSPVDVFRREFPDVLVVNGDERKNDILARYKKFNDDTTGPQVMLVQAAKSAGWSGHDTTGKHQRVLINLGQPTQPTRAIQQEGRIYRVGQASNAIIRYLNTGTNWERWTFASTIATRASAAENLAMGEQARALKDAFIEAFEESSDEFRAGHEGEGTGGKARDRATTAVLTEWDRAKTMYFGQRKRTSRDKAVEGIDYFATPEPLGLKMAEWADIRPGEAALEPSAGHGAIARWIREDAARTAVEPSGELRSRLALTFGGLNTKIVDSTFENLHVVNKYDAIVMNPPFGTAGRTAIDHLAKAATHLRIGGRIVALIPTGPAADAKFDKWFYGEDAPGLHLVANITLPRATFERAGTSVAARVVVLEKPMAGANAPQQRNIDLSGAEDIEAFFDRLQNVEVAPRTKPVVTESATAGPGAMPAADVPEGQTYTTDAPEIIYTTKKGKELRGVIAKDLTLDQAKAIDPYTWKMQGGYFIRAKYVVRPDGGGANEGQGVYLVNGKNAVVQRDRALSVEAPPPRRRGAGRLPSPNLDLFAPTDVPAETARAQAVGNFRIQVEQVAARTFLSATDTVKTPEDALHVLQPLGDRAQEEFLAIVTDEDDKILNVIGHTKGSFNASSVYPGVILGSVIATPGAANVWFGHNHPSGAASPSSSDIQLTQRLESRLKDMGITYRGHAIVGDEHGSFIDPGDTHGYPVRFPRHGERSRAIPVTERVFSRRDKAMTVISSPDSARSYVGGLQGDGIVLLDNQHGVIGFLAMSQAEIASMKANNHTGIRRLLGTISETGAAVMIARFENPPSVIESAAKNLATFADRFEVRLLDVFADGVSFAERAAVPSAGDALLSRGNRGAGHTEASLYERLRAVFGAKFMAALFKSGRFRVVTSREAERILGPRAMRSTGDLLSGYTEDDLRAQAESDKASAKARQAAAKAEEARRKADAARDDFRLVGSNSQADMAEAYGQESLFSARGDVRAFYNPADGITYLIADHIPAGFTDAQLRGLMRHELGVHALKAGRDSEGWQKILAEIDRLITSGDTQAVAALERARAAGTPAGQLLEEVAGYLVEDAPASSIAQKILAWFKAQVLRLTKFNLKLSAADITEMAQAALRSAPLKLGEQRSQKNEAVDQAFIFPGAQALSPYSRLDVSTPARLARAREQGYIFDLGELPGAVGDVYRGRTEAVRRTAREGRDAGGNARRAAKPSLATQGFFHGSRDDIDRFDTEHPNRKDYGWLGRGAYAASVPVLANKYANLKRGPEGPNVMRLALRIKNPALLTLEDKGRLMGMSQARVDRFTADLIAKGHDSAALIWPDGSAEVVVFDPSRVRSVNARFDAANIGSSDLLASQPAPVWVSTLRQRIAEQGDKLRTGTDWKAWLLGNAAKLGVKKDEIEWSGITDYLDTRGKDKLKTTDITDWLDANGVQITETVMGGTGTYPEGSYMHPTTGDVQSLADWRDAAEDFSDEGGESIEEQLESLIDVSGEPIRKKGQDTKYSNYQLPGGENYRELLLTLPYPHEAAMRGDAHVFQSGHFDHPNILAHVRFNERTDSDGRRVLFVEELQGDWPQEYRKQTSAINKAVDSDMLGIIERMKKAGVLEVNCD